MGYTFKGWAKSTDLIYSTGLVVAGRKVEAFVKDVARESPAGKPGAQPLNPPKEGPGGEDPKKKA